MRARLLFVRMAAMRHHIDRVEPALEEALIGVELELVRHDAGRIREHAVFRDNGITFDAGRPRHSSQLLALYRQAQAGRGYAREENGCMCATLPGL